VRTAFVLTCALAFAGLTAFGQEADSGLDVRATFSAAAFDSGDLREAPRNGSPIDAGFRAVFYPTLKIDEHWSVDVAWQAMSRPYFYETYSTQGHGVKTDILNATVNYAHAAGRGLITARIGEMPTAFGAFALRYDDMQNPLFDKPLEYGYEYAPVSTLAVAGVQVDASSGKWDGRAQFANSSPWNPRSLTERHQYGNWAGGGGYTIRQGLRVGASAYYGTANPVTHGARAVGADVQFAHGHWYTNGEIQHFVFPWKAIPTGRTQAGYVEVKRVLTPRWYVATRTGYEHAYFGRMESYQFAAGFRPGANQLIKLDYRLDREDGENHATVAVEFVTAVHPLSIAFR